MHSIWNPWHGCKKRSEGCDNCYMYFLDEKRGLNGADIYKVKSAFDYPLQKNRRGAYKIQSGEMISVCMTSDFFLEEADKWRGEAWEIIRQRADVKFLFITKRPERIPDCLPDGWGDGWENVFINVTAENQLRADERVPMLLGLPVKHRGVNVAPFIGEVSLEKWLSGGKIEQVVAGGENYGGARPCYYDWIKKLRAECVVHNVTFCFYETGTRFIKDGKAYTLLGKRIQTEMALKSGMNFVGKSMEFKLYNECGAEIPKEFLYTPVFGEHCELCSQKIICNGCFNCGRCSNINQAGDFGLPQQHFKMNR